MTEKQKIRLKGKKQIVFFLLSLGLVGLLFSEVFLSVFFPIPFSSSKRYQLLTLPYLKMDLDGSVKYVRNKKMRAVKVHDNQIEYDIKFQTNNMGLIDHKPYNAEKNLGNKKRYVFVGDSFTAGVEGGNPWVPQLRDRVQRLQENLEIFNLGVAGTGLVHFNKILRSFHKRIDFSHLVILVISGDFSRWHWRPVTTQRDMQFCRPHESDSQCLGRHSIFLAIDYKATKDDVWKLVEEASQRKLEQLEDFKRKRPFQSLLEKTQVFSRVKILINRRSQKKRIDAGFNSLKDIKKYFSDKKIYLIHLPIQSEIDRTRYSLNLEKFSSENNFEYFPALTECNWEPGMFHELDGHPNAKGYQSISDCVWEYLRGKP